MINIFKGLANSKDAHQMLKLAAEKAQQELMTIIEDQWKNQDKKEAWDKGYNSIYDERKALEKKEEKSRKAYESAKRALNEYEQDMVKHYD